LEGIRTIEDDEAVCGFCGNHYRPAILDTNPSFTYYNYKCPKCGGNDYNKTIYHNEEDNVFQPLVSN